MGYYGHVHSHAAMINILDDPALTSLPPESKCLAQLVRIFDVLIFDTIHGTADRAAALEQLATYGFTLTAELLGE